MTADSGRIVVVGASMAGLRSAEALRKTDYAGEILVIGEEPHPPYNRPPLTKEALADGPDPAALALRIPRRAQDVTWRLGTTVVSADLEARTVTTDAGDVIRYDGLVAATGLRSRRLTLPGPLAGRHAIRTIEDSIGLRAALRPGARLVVIGAGFIGCEVAATATRLGVQVDVVAPEDVPMERPLRHLLGEALGRRHESHGVRFHLKTVPVSFLGEDRVSGVELATGEVLPADVVVEAIGCAPNVDWLDGNGLDLRDGLCCDDRLRVDGRADVVACGDVARFANARDDDVPRRVEHWTMVTDTAKKAGDSLGRHLAGAPDGEPFLPVPSFWSDQYDMRLQSFGVIGREGDEVAILEGDLDGDAAVGYLRDGRLVGVVMLGLAGRHTHYHQLIAESLPATDPA